MAWCLMLWKAIKVRRAFVAMKQAKRNAYRASIGLPPTYPIYERPFRWIGRKLKTLFMNTCCRCCKKRPGGKLSNWGKIWKGGTLQNDVFKGVMGFIVGMIFTKLLVDFLKAQLNFNSEIITAVAIIFGVFLTIGLTFSDTVRCLFGLAIPQFFNTKGRAAILAYAMILAISGPGKNTAMNMEILTESLVCGQDMVKESTNNLLKLAKEPYSMLKNAINVIIKSVEEVLSRMNSELQGVIRTISDIINVIKTAYKKLKSIVNMCNDKLGAPSDRCMSAFKEASDDCKYRLGSTFDFACSVVDVFQHLCYIADAPTALFCWLPSLVKQVVFEPLEELFKIFAEGFKKFFDVRLNITYKLDHDSNQSKSFRNIAHDLKADIMGRVQWILDYMDWVDLFVSFCFLMVVWKAFSYRYKYLNSESYDNFYITKGMIRMDLERRKLGRDSIFPLRYRECKIYVETFSWAMVEHERYKMIRSLILVTLAGIQILNYLLIDYLLYLFLELIKRYGAIEFDSQEWFDITFSVEGEGFLAAMYRSIIEGLSPNGDLLPAFNSTKCLPEAHKPNYLQYFLIVFLLLLCLTVAIFEPYGLRLRHIVCGWVYPERINPRDRWLYIHILSSRDNFLVFARRQIRANKKGNRTDFRISLKDRLYHTIPCCKRYFESHGKKCYLCGQSGDMDDNELFIECPNCGTVYCKECFVDIQSKCTACLSPIDYGDLTDISEELGSDIDDESEPDFFDKCCSRGASKLNRNKSKSKQSLVSKSSKSKRSKRSKRIERNESILIDMNEHRQKVPQQHKKNYSSQRSKTKSKTSKLKNKSKDESKSLMTFDSQKKSKSNKRSKRSATETKSTISPRKNKKSKSKSKSKSKKSKGIKFSKKLAGNFTPSKSAMFSMALNNMGNNRMTERTLKKNKNKYQRLPSRSPNSTLKNKSKSKSKRRKSSNRTKDTPSNFKPKPMIRNKKGYERLQQSPSPEGKIHARSKRHRDAKDTRSKHHGSHPKSRRSRRSVGNEVERRESHDIPQEDLLIQIDPYAAASGEVFEEEIDGLDAGGICRHHTQAEPETVAKFNNVLQEFVYFSNSQINQFKNDQDGSNKKHRSKSKSKGRHH